MTGKKIMGLPVVVWAGVLAGGLLLGLWLRSRGSSSSGPQVLVPDQALSFPDGGLSGQSVGGNSAPDTSAFDPATLSDLLNGQAALSNAETILTEQNQGLTDAIGSLVYQLGSSAGSGASASGTKTQPKHKSHKPVQHHPKHHKPKHHKPKKKAGHH